MAKKPSKKRTTVAKKATPKRGLINPIKPRKATPRMNQLRLEQDIAYYDSQSPTNTKRRTKGNERHPRGLPLDSLHYNGYQHQYNDGKYHSVDNSIKLTRAEYEKILLNPSAVPQYTPIHGKDKNGKKKIVSFRNSHSGQIVTPYYRYHIFGRYFSRVTADSDTEEYKDEVLRSNVYYASLEQQKRGRLTRHYSLIDSYGVRNQQFKEKYPKSWRSKIAKDPTFNELVEELESWNYHLYGITDENIALYDKLYGIPASLETIEEQKRWLINLINDDPDYKRVLELLGRRLPNSDWRIGESDPNHIKNVVMPYYEGLYNAKDYEEEDDE